MSKSDDVSIWLPIYIGEMLAMTTRFSTEQIGALYLLMMDYWKNGDIPYDYKTISAIIGLSPNKTKTFIALILDLGIFEQSNDRLISSYLDEKKQTATANKKVKSERARKGALGRWNKTKQDEDSLSSAQASDYECSSNANDMLEECPSSLSSSNNSTLSQASLKIEPIKLWKAPSLIKINELLKKSSASFILDLKTYEAHLSKFKNYYSEQEQLNRPIVTEERRQDVLTNWIINDRQYQSKSNKKGASDAKAHTTKARQSNAFDQASSYVEQTQQDVDRFFDHVPCTA